MSSSESDDSSILLRRLEAACEVRRQSPDRILKTTWSDLWETARHEFLSLYEEHPSVLATFRTPIFRLGSNSSEVARTTWYPFLHFCYSHQGPIDPFEIVLNYYSSHLYLETCETDIGVYKSTTLRDTIIEFPYLFRPYLASRREMESSCVAKLQMFNVVIQKEPNSFRLLDKHWVPSQLRLSPSQIFCSIFADPDVAKQVVPVMEEVYGKDVILAWLAKQGEAVDIYENGVQEYPFYAINKLVQWHGAKKTKLILSLDHGESYDSVSAEYEKDSAALTITTTFSTAIESPFGLKTILQGMCSGPIPLLSCIFEDYQFVDSAMDGFGPGIPTLDHFVLDDGGAFANLQEFQVLASVTDPNQMAAFSKSLSASHAETSMALSLGVSRLGDVQTWDTGIASLASLEKLDYLAMHLDEASYFPAEGFREFLKRTTSTAVLSIKNYPLRTLEALAQGVAHNKSLSDLYVYPRSDGVELDYKPLISVLKTSNCTLGCYEDSSDRWCTIQDMCQLNKAGRFRLLKEDATKETLVQVLDDLQRNSYRKDDTNIVYQLLQVRPDLLSTS